MIKKSIIAVVVFLFTTKVFSLSLEDLSKMLMESNADIMEASVEYQKEVLSAKYLNGAYTPRVTLSSSATILKAENAKDLPENFSSRLVYAQPLPGGASISLETDYSFNSAEYDDLCYLKQQPGLSFTLSQSLMPFWIQGQIKDPVKLSVKKREEYSFYQLQYIKKNIWSNLVQYYVYSLTSKNEINIYMNSVRLFELQIESMKALKAQGKASQSAILELENSKWTAEQSLMSAQAEYFTNVQNLKVICGQNFDEELLEPFEENENYESAFFMGDEGKDPLEETYKLKLEILKTSRISEKQANAPVLNLSLQPELNLNATKKEEWQKAWNDMDSPSKWTLGIGLDLSPMFSGLAYQNKKKYQIEYKAAIDSYNLYLEKRNFVLQQYKDLLEQYINQQKRIDFLYDSGLKEFADYKMQFEREEISKLDFESSRVRVENLRLKKENIHLLVWLYEFFIKINTYN